MSKRGPSLIPAAGIVVLLGAPAAFDAAAATLSTADKAWIATCMDQLKLENPNRKIVRRYCLCMHGYFEDNEKVSQSDMEHMFPPAHALCNKKSGWK